MSQFKRIMLKLSGEQLAGTNDHGIDPEFVNWLAGEIKSIAHDTQVVIVVGGGNFIRGASFAGDGIDRATADYMGMLSTVLNGMALTDMLEHNGLPTRLQTSVEMKQVAEPFIRLRAIRHLEKGRVVIVAAGIGKPYMTTDTAAVTIALELGCEVILKGTNVDGVFNQDPRQHQDATKYDNVDFQTVMENPEIKVMDKAALGLAMEQKRPIVVFNIHESGNLRKIVDGEPVGTRVQPDIAT